MIIIQVLIFLLLLAWEVYSVWVSLYLLAELPSALWQSTITTWQKYRELWKETME